MIGGCKLSEHLGNRLGQSLAMNVAQMRWVKRRIGAANLGRRDGEKED